MTTRTSIILVLAGILLIGGLWSAIKTAPIENNNGTTSDQGGGLEQNIPGNDKLRIFSPLPNGVITSPVSLRGEARGNWYFEASFPIRLLDANGKELAVAVAQAQGEWMTEDFVPFNVNMSFPVPTTSTGTLVFQKDNPSGLPEHDDEFRMPVRFR
ncbi:MAG: hypothetical protein A3C85_04415 [Candidatus Doudnabacteria bacterium RIFCSPHIGHO2_02_FULL_48_21]|uniref:Bacterial spore germination immunoglobulin-like domain-containing protein n=1 Tax=Candidatus Doudnabacteria bacterium RIFCSPLOWO2_02_FULL_48_13 TaxID=1817845 RepID=A0A1F5QCJ5_9BACT|nr:MAG: hypothetical protein A3K05_00650 [Candidatus Doudnabacteria bacterium RIFCSPHIGHO2_01_48_18]OGE79658.1 MAG: hypothetical protein A2668_01000 [Candidatus Doudnabacteria bacterium RIFCSPHIGHO2_01_FULL_48_180]OGE91458.1 MAG: hypothetical protein A3F44_01200 [Candidatus Doudnabacteria bacterium RIFCSPHIGHO2_12_FULL_47_25]OGE93073.1 MAG: hypothetical protein A3C85_04415 [Candidatus Doudnabacteria bacterium RIFCSPHIGHO2_02_FULL_48_21]OGE98080.1 MAG: hypothetical protein A3A83_02380 [Candidatu